MRGFVDDEGAAWWALVALDADTTGVEAMIFGDRSEHTAQCLRDALPEAYQFGAMIFTDFWAAYRAVLPAGQHTRCGKGEGRTNHVERSWCTLRQRCGRFLRKSPSSS
jgi:insertion element IS1 protein InsB